MLQNIKKIEGGPFGDIEKLSKKKRENIILNSLVVTKNVERGLWAFSTSLQLQNILKIERGTLWRQTQFSKKSHSAEKIERGPFLIYKHAFCCKITKNSKGGPFGNFKKFSKKKSHTAEKNQKGDPFVSAGFVGYVEKVKNKRGNLWRQKKFRKKCRTVPKKIERGDPLVSAGFVGYVKKVKKKGEPFGDKKIFGKNVAQCRKKIKRGTP